jgi:hypothetical protein
MHRPLLCAALAVAIFAGAGCADDELEGLPPTAPTNPEITEPPFTGTLTVNGGVTKPFDVSAVGTVTAIIDSLEPAAASLTVGLALGTWNGTSCQVVLANDTAGVGSGIAGFANGAGNLCARIYDIGQLTEPVTFTVTIKHF